jgi:hypothetical protein
VARISIEVTLGLSAASAGPAADFGRKDTVGWNMGPLSPGPSPNTGIAQARIAQAETGTPPRSPEFDGAVLTALRERKLRSAPTRANSTAVLHCRLRAADARRWRRRRASYQNGRAAYLEHSMPALPGGGDAALAASGATVRRSGGAVRSSAAAGARTRSSKPGCPPGRQRVEKPAARAGTSVHGA